MLTGAGVMHGACAIFLIDEYGFPIYLPLTSTFYTNLLPEWM